MARLVHLFGSAAVIYVIAYIIVDFIEKKKLNVSDIISRVVVLAMLFVILLRT